MKLAVCISLLAVSCSALCLAQDLPEGKGKDLVNNICGSCHGVDVVTAQRATKDGWVAIVQEMVSRGAQASDQEVETMAEYLAKNFPAEPMKVHINKATAQDLQTNLGLTPDEATAIVKYRTDHGSFKDWDSLTKVTGVDTAKLQAKKDTIAFD